MAHLSSKLSSEGIANRLPETISAWVDYHGKHDDEPWDDPWDHCYPSQPSECFGVSALTPMFWPFQQPDS